MQRAASTALTLAATLRCRARRSSQFEAYLGFRVATESGLGDARDPTYRTTIVPILGAGQRVGQHILEMWGRGTVKVGTLRKGQQRAIPEGAKTRVFI